MKYSLCIIRKMAQHTVVAFITEAKLNLVFLEESKQSCSSEMEGLVTMLNISEADLIIM